MEDTIIERAVRIPPVGLSGDLIVPEAAAGIVLFAHGSGSSRHSARNRYVARFLQEGGFATLLLDLLTAAEEQVAGHELSPLISRQAHGTPGMPGSYRYVGHASWPVPQPKEIFAILREEVHLPGKKKPYGAIESDQILWSSKCCPFYFPARNGRRA
jgi:hypothetical protein